MDASVEYHGSVVDNYKRLIREQDEELQRLKQELSEARVRRRGGEGGWVAPTWVRRFLHFPSNIAPLGRPMFISSPAADAQQRRALHQRRGHLAGAGV